MLRILLTTLREEGNTLTENDSRKRQTSTATPVKPGSLFFQ